MEIVPGIHQIDGVKGNCYVIVRDGLILIDTGLPRTSKKILGYIQDTHKRKLLEISTIILTHHHIDHTGNVYELKTLSGAKVAIHEADADFVSGRKPRPAPKGGPGMLIRLLGIFFKSTFVEPDIRLKNGDTIAGSPACTHPDIHRAAPVFLIRYQKSFFVVI